MIESEVYLDGRSLSEFGLFLRPGHEHPIPETRDTTIEIPHMNGLRYITSTVGPRIINLPVGIIPQLNKTDLQKKIREFTAFLFDEYGKPREIRLSFGYEPEKYYKVRYSGSITPERLITMGVFELPFIAYDPFAYAPATYYDPDVVGNYADSVYGFEIVGKHDANHKPIENPTLLGQIGGRNLIRNTSDKNKTVSWSGWDYRFILVPHIEDIGLSVGDSIVFRVYIEETNAPVRAFVEFVLNDGSGIRYRQKNGNIIYEGESGWSEVKFIISEEDVRDLQQFKVAIRNMNNSNATVTYRKAKMERGNKATDWTPAPEDEGWPMKLVIEDKFYGDGTKNDRLIFEDGELYKEQWWEIINGIPFLKDKPEKKLVKQKGGIYIAEGINTIHLTDDSGLLDSAIIRYQKGTIPIAKGDNIIDIPKLDFNTYGVDLEYKNQVYSPFKNRRQYVGVYNYSQYETPFSFVIQGYCRNPRITNQTTGKSLKFNDLTLGANERLYVDSRRMTAWKIKIADDKYEFLTPHKIMRDYDAWDKINAHPNKSGDFLMLTAGSNSILFESDDTPDAEIYLDWEHRFL